jgi:carboxyl-terminal processing protease
MRKAARPLLLALGAAIGSFSAILITAGAASALPKKLSPYHKLNIFTRVLAYVENNYVEDVDQDKLIYGAIKGMLETLDPHTSFMDPQQYRDMKSETTGQFGGVGIEVEVRDGILTIMSALDGTPAAKAGLTTGDQILKIEDTVTKGITIDEAIARMRGRRGAPVRLTIGRKSWKEPKQMTLVRDIIKVENVTWKMLEPGYGYVRVKQFTENADREMGDAIDLLDRDAPGGRLRGLVLDLRNNPGGLLDQAVRIADQFIEEGPIVRTEGKGGRTIDEEKAHLRGTRTGYPIICLVNGGSASASEIVAGALQDHNRAVIMGTQTFGKGSVQTVIELDDGSALKLTIARYYTPSGRSIQENGITPDVVVEKIHMADLKPDRADEPDKKERDLSGHLRNTQGTKAAPAAVSNLALGPAGDDFQLHTALDYLKAWQIFRASGGMMVGKDGKPLAGRQW